MAPTDNNYSRGCVGRPGIFLRRWGLFHRALWISAFFLLSGGGEAQGQAKDASGLVRWTTRAVGQMIGGDLVGAVGSIARARQAAARPELDALIGLVALMGQQPKEALAQLTAAIDHGSTEPMVFYWAARAALRLGRRAQAAKRMHQSVTLAPRHPTIRMGQTLMLLAAGRRNQGAKALVAVAALEPNLLDPMLYPTALAGAIGLLGNILQHPAPLQVIRTQGYLYWRTKRVTAALKSFGEISIKRPQDGDALQMIARCQMALGQDDLALATAQRAVKCAPDFPQVYATRGEILLDQGQPALAVPDLQRAANKLPRDSRLLARLAEACAAAEKPKCARRYFAYAVERSKNNAAAHFGMAQVYQLDRKWALSEASFQRAIGLEPGKAMYYQGASHLARLQGNVRKANKLRAQARELAKLERRYKRIFLGINNQIKKQVSALSLLAQHPQCPKSCERKIRSTSRSARQYLKIHLAQKRMRIRQAQGLALTLVDQLNPSRLLSRDPTLVKFKGKTRNGDDFSVRNIFPFVPPSRFK